MKTSQQLETSNKEKTPLFKFIVIGDQSVGKSCLVKRYQENDYKEIQKPTIGIEFIKKVVKVDKSEVEIQIWDTAGQEQFRSMIRSFYRGSAAVFIVYSINSKESFDSLDEWLKEVDQFAHEDVIKILVGSKCDLQRNVEKKDAKEFMNKNKFSLFFETSAKTGENVEEAFVEAVKLVVLRFFSSESFRNAVSSQRKKVNADVKPNETHTLQQGNKNNTNGIQENKEQKCC